MSLLRPIHRYHSRAYLIRMVGPINILYGYIMESVKDQSRDFFDLVFYQSAPILILYALFSLPIISDADLF
jgi:hypothetical protein